VCEPMVTDCNPCLNDSEPEARAEERTPLQEEELEALMAPEGDRRLVLRVVSALRMYRAAARKLIEQRYEGGGADRVMMGDFEQEIGGIGGAGEKS